MARRLQRNREAPESQASCLAPSWTSQPVIARLHARGLPPAVSWDDLLQEAITRVLTGKRVKPADLPMVAFLGGVMRSLRADHIRRARHGVKRDDPLWLGSTLEESWELEVLDPAADPERASRTSSTSRSCARPTPSSCARNDPSSRTTGRRIVRTTRSSQAAAYSGSNVPEPPISAGMSLNFGFPSRIGSTVS